MDLKDGLYGEIVNLYSHWEKEQGWVIMLC